jgi:hypothetical protein
MKIYLAGNTPDRVREEKRFEKIGLLPNRLMAYIYIINDTGVRSIFNFLTKRGPDAYNNGRSSWRRKSRGM